MTAIGLTQSVIAIAEFDGLLDDALIPDVARVALRKAASLALAASCRDVLANDPLRVAAIEYIDAHREDHDSYKRAGFAKLVSAQRRAQSEGIRPMSNSMIEVVSAVILADGQRIVGNGKASDPSLRILLTQRRPEKDYGFRWECPGGKVVGNESHHDALRRELGEEIGMEVGAIQETPLFCHEMEVAIGRIFHAFYVVTDWHLTPCPREGQGIGWFARQELGGLLLTPGNVAASRAIARAMEHHVDGAFA